MAHHTKHRRSLAAPEPVPLTEPSFKKHPKPTAATAPYSSQAAAKTSDTLPSKTHSLPNTVYSRLYTIARHKARMPTIDTHFQAKPLNASADFESCKHKTGQGIEKQRKKTEDACELVKPKKASVKEKRGDKAVENGVVDFKKFNSLLLDKELRRSHEELEARRSSGSLAAAVGGRRRSFCGLQVELGDVFASNGVKVVSVDMPPFMQIHAVDSARKTCDSLEKFTCKTLALTLKKEFDGVYGPAWHCIVGTSFGSFVTHSVGGFMYFSMDQKMYILLFKTTVQRAD